MSSCAPSGSRIDHDGSRCKVKGWPHGGRSVPEGPERGQILTFPNTYDLRCHTNRSPPAHKSTSANDSLPATEGNSSHTPIDLPARSRTPPMTAPRRLSATVSVRRSISTVECQSLPKSQHARLRSSAKHAHRLGKVKGWPHERRSVPGGLERGQTLTLPSRWTSEAKPLQPRLHSSCSPESPTPTSRRAS